MSAVDERTPAGPDMVSVTLTVRRRADGRPTEISLMAIATWDGEAWQDLRLAAIADVLPWTLDALTAREQRELWAMLDRARLAALGRLAAELGAKARAS